MVLGYFTRRKRMPVPQGRNMNVVKALLFDLDGTLLDTLEDLADAVNAVLERAGYPAHPVDAYRYFVGSGLETMLRRAAPEGLDDGALADLALAFRGTYAKNWDAKTRPYPGVESVLEALVKTGLPFAVLSNKPHDFTQLCVNRFFPSIAFTAVQGSPKGGRAKPDPAMALALAGDFGVLPGEVLFVGDSSVDMDTATGAGMIAAGALWGFRPESELVAHGARVLLAKPSDILDQLG